MGATASGAKVAKETRSNSPHKANYASIDVESREELIDASKKRKHDHEGSKSDFEPKPRCKRSKTKNQTTKATNQRRTHKARKASNSSKNNVTTASEIVRGGNERRLDYFNRDVEPAVPPPVNSYIEIEDIDNEKVKTNLLQGTEGTDMEVPINTEYYNAIKDLVIDAAEGNLEHAYFVTGRTMQFLNGRAIIDKTEGGFSRATQTALKCLPSAEWNVEMAESYFGTYDYSPLWDRMHNRCYEEFKGGITAKRRAGKVIASEYWLCQKEAGEPMPDLRIMLQASLDTARQTRQIGPPSG